MLSLVPHKRLAAFVVRRLACRPELYSSLLAVNCGVRTLWELSPSDLLGFAFGRREVPPGGF